MGGVESQGSRTTLMDYNPTYNEGIEYWRSSILKLEKLLIEDLKNRAIVKEILLQKLAGLVLNRCFHLISVAIYRILEILPESKLEVYRATEKAIAIGGRYISEEESENLAKLLDAAGPRTFLERYKSFIATPNYNYTSVKSFDEQLSEKAKEMAQEFIGDSLTWADYCDNFLKLDQQGGFIFGKQRRLSPHQYGL
jgi:hypothetical protein